MIGKGKRNDSFETPNWLFNKLNARFNFTVDAASTEENKKCEKRLKDGLRDKWTGRVFCNPPFSQKKEWMEKAHKSIESGECDLCVMLLPTNSMSSIFWHDFVFGKYHYEIISTRVNFIDPETKKEAIGADSGTTVIYFMKKIDAREK